MRLYGNSYLARAQTGSHAAIVRNVLASQSDGLAALPEISARLDSAGGSLPGETLARLHYAPHASDLRDAVAHYLASQMDDPEIVRQAARALYGLAMDGGRPAAAARYLDLLRRAGQGDSTRHLVTTVRDGLFWDGDPDAAARAAAALETQVARLPADSISGSLAEALCVAGQWRLAQGETAAATPIIDRLRALGGDGQEGLGAAVGCVELLGAWQAAEAAAPDAPARIALLDSLLASGHIPPGRLVHEANLILARLLEARGDRRGALRVLSHRPLLNTNLSYGSTFLRERGRVASLLGDTATAVAAYRRYLTMRSNPEPAQVAGIERLHGKLVRIGRSGGAW